MYRIGICDDDQNICEELGGMIGKIMKEFQEEFVREAWHCGEELYAYLNAGKGCDLLFLDIELPGVSGVDAGNIFGMNWITLRPPSFTFPTIPDMRCSSSGSSRWIF